MIDTTVRWCRAPGCHRRTLYGPRCEAHLPVVSAASGPEGGPNKGGPKKGGPKKGGSLRGHAGELVLPPLPQLPLQLQGPRELEKYSRDQAQRAMQAVRAMRGSMTELVTSLVALDSAFQQALPTGLG